MMIVRHHTEDHPRGQRGQSETRKETHFIAPNGNQNRIIKNSFHRAPPEPETRRKNHRDLEEGNLFDAKSFQLLDGRPASALPRDDEDDGDEDDIVLDEDVEVDLLRGGAGGGVIGSTFTLQSFEFRFGEMRAGKLSVFVHCDKLRTIMDAPTRSSAFRPIVIGFKPPRGLLQLDIETRVTQPIPNRAGRSALAPQPCGKRPYHYYYYYHATGANRLQGPKRERSHPLYLDRCNCMEMERTIRRQRRTGPWFIIVAERDPIEVGDAPAKCELLCCDDTIENFAHRVRIDFLRSAIETVRDEDRMRRRNADEFLSVSLPPQRGERENSRSLSGIF
uniref:Uncharacterized protein n=1 Tax=Anopheles atroparvus TaxID=41427 RepID=A0A182IUS3_ANOAO